MVLRVGGVYADVDTECRKPLSGLIRARDTLVVAWEGAVVGADEDRRPVRRRQHQAGRSRATLCVVTTMGSA